MSLFLINVAALMVALGLYRLAHVMVVRFGLPGFFTFIGHGVLILIQITVMVIWLFSAHILAGPFYWLWLVPAIAVPVVYMLRR